MGQDLDVALVDVAHGGGRLRRDLAREAVEDHERLVRPIPRAANDPPHHRALHAGADRRNCFRESLHTGQEKGREPE